MPSTDRLAKQVRRGVGAERRQVGGRPLPVFKEEVALQHEKGHLRTDLGRVDSGQQEAACRIGDGDEIASRGVRVEQGEVRRVVAWIACLGPKRFGVDDARPEIQ